MGFKLLKAVGISKTTYENQKSKIGKESSKYK
jgi:hypothetical protein